MRSLRLRGAAVLRFQVVRRKSLLQQREGLFRRVGELEEIQIPGRDSALLDKYIEVDYRFPIRRTIDDDRDLLGQLFGLRQSEDFEGLIDRAKTAGKDHQRLRKIREPVLAHEEIVELEVQRRRDIGIRHLLEWQLDVESDSVAAGFVRSAVCGLPNSRPAPRG